MHRRTSAALRTLVLATALKWSIGCKSVSSFRIERGGKPYGVDIHERHAGEASDDWDELIEIVRSKPRDTGAEHHDEEAEDVLLPFDVGVVFAASREQFVLRDSDGWEEL